MESTANCKTPCPVSRQVSALDWDNLWRASLEPHPNQAPTWYQTWKSTFGVTDDTLLSVSANDKPALIAPLRIEPQTNTAHFLYTDDLIDRNDFIYADSDQLKPCLDQLIHYLRSEHGVRNLALSSLVDTSPTPAALRELATENGWQCTIETTEKSPWLHLPTDWDEYLAALPKKDRHELRRKLRRISDGRAIERENLTTPTDVQAALPEFMRLYRQSTVAKDNFMNPAYEKFFYALATNFAKLQMLNLTFLNVDGQRLAASLAFISAGQLYLYNSGFSTQHRHIAPGLMNHALNIKAAIQSGIRVFDFMRGDEPYKYHLGATDRNILKVDLVLDV